MAFGLVLGLRLAGLFVGPSAVVLTVIALVLAPGPRRLSDRFILFFAIGFGWLILLGWVPRLETNIDVPGLLLATTSGLAAANQFRSGHWRPALPRRPVAAEYAALVIGAAATLWWAAPFFRLNASGRLKALFPGWDNSAFFDMFKQILVHGSFNTISSQGPGDGLPQTWALLVRLWSPHPPTGAASLLNAYDAVLFVTLGGIVTLGCMSVARLCEGDFWVTLPAMAAVVQIFVVGRLWIVNGYPTFDLPIACATAAVLLSWRPTSRPWPHFVAIAGLTLVAAYTWFPIVVLCAPALLVAALRLLKESSGRSRGITLLALGFTGIAYLGPLVHFHNEAGKFTFSYSTSGVNAGAVWTPETPWVLTVLTIVGGLILCIIISRFAPGTGRRLGLLAAPIVIGGLGLLGLVASERSAAHHVSYYGHKWGTGMFGLCLVILVTLLVTSFAYTKLRRRVPTLAVALLACLASIAVLEIDGFVGPFANANSARLAKGYAAHKSIAKSAVGSREDRDLLASVHLARHQPASGTRWAFVDPDALYNCGLEDEWFFALSGQLSLTGGYGEWNDFPCRYGLGDAATATYIVNTFRDPVSARIHLFVPASLAQAITSLNQAWSSPGVLHILQSP